MDFVHYGCLWYVYSLAKHMAVSDFLPGWSGGAMVLGKLPVRPTILITVGQGPTALAVGAGGVVWRFLLSSILSPSVWETARYLVGCLGFNGPLRQYFSLYRAVSQREGER